MTDRLVTPTTAAVGNKSDDCGAYLNLWRPDRSRAIYFCDLNPGHPGPHRGDDGTYWSGSIS